MHMICFTPQAADENKKNNYEKALSLHTKARRFNATGFVFLVVAVYMFLIFAPILIIVGPTVYYTVNPPDY